MGVADLKDDLQPWRDVTIARVAGPRAGTTGVYKVWFNANAIYKLERAIGEGFESFMGKFGAEKSGFAELHVLLYAGLEGARLKMFPRRPEWTVESVGDLIDEAGGQRIIWIQSNTARLLGQAVAAGLPKPKKPAPADSPAGEGEPAAEGAGAAPDPSTASPGSTGPASSPAPRTAGSAKSRSGR